MLGLKFEHCNPFLFSVNFESCQLNLSSFYKLKLKKIKFSNCTLHEVDFTEADLSEASFVNCDLHGATFEYCTLTKADFRTAVNFAIHPETNKIAKARFSRQNLEGLLLRYDINIEQ